MPSVETEVPVGIISDVEKQNISEEDVIVPGPSAKKEFTEKKLKAVVKEGGKRGIEIEGAADMGGLQFFCTQIGEPLGDLDLLIESVKAMNAKSDPTEEERKGGAGRIGKIVFSCTESVFSAVAYVPRDKAEQCDATEWLSEVVLNVASAECVKTIQNFEGIDPKYWAAVTIGICGEKDLYPIKMRDPSISMAYNFLKKRGLFPDGDDEDDDDYVFGDDDFP